MKIKAVWKDEEVAFPNDDITLGKEYEVLMDHGDAFNIIDDAGDYIFISLTGSSHGFDFEVVQEEPEHKTPKFKVGDKVACLKSDVLNELFIDKIGVVVRVYAEYDHEPSYEVDFREFFQICCEVLDEMVLVKSCPDPMPVVEPVDDLGCDRIEDNLNWLEGLTNGSPDQPTEGGPAEYYDFKPNWVTLNDMNDYKAQHQWGPLSFHMGNISKATYRFGEKGNTSKVYDINKIIYSGLRCKLMLEDKKAVRKYLQQLLDDPQFQENTK